MHQKVTFDQAIVVPESGYIYVWVSNESENTKVWFDDLKITRSSSYVTQATDYGVWGDVVREQKSNSDTTKYEWGYQGQFAEKDEETGWSHFEAREFDPIIGRWTSTDPAGQFYSPYVGMGNNPVSGTDPDGRWLFKSIGSSSEQRKAARAIRNGHEGSEINNFFGKNISVTYQSGNSEINSEYLNYGGSLFTTVVSSTTINFQKNGMIDHGDDLVNLMFADEEREFRITCQILSPHSPSPGTVVFDPLTQLSLGFIAVNLAQAAPMTLLRTAAAVSAGYWRAGAALNAVNLYGSMYARNIVFRTTLAAAPILGKTQYGRGIALRLAWFSHDGSINFGKLMQKGLEKGVKNAHELFD